MKISFITLGCKTNQYESEQMGKMLGDVGFEISFGFDIADIYVINSCSVTAEADKKSRQMVSKCLKLNPKADVIICGCSSERDKTQYINKKGVNLVLGTANKMDLVDFIKQNYALSTPKTVDFRTRKYLKIQDGCNNFCTYCIIPYLRGREKSRPIEDIVSEAKEIEKSCSEIVLTGINMSAFGRENGTTLTGLMLALKDINARIRIGSLEARVITEEFLLALKELKNFCPHFHLSVQSGCTDVLKAMNRHYTAQEFEEKVALIRKHFENPFIACDLIVGFPTETDENFRETIAFLNRVNFSFIHIFPYSRREGTIASKMPTLVAEIVKQREEVVKQINEKGKNDYIKGILGQKLEVLIEKHENGQSMGYSKEYVMCYINEKLPVGSVVALTAVEKYNDGVLCVKI